MAINKDGVIYHELHKNKAIDSNLYNSFLEVIVSEHKNKYILMDNVSFHKSKKIVETIENSGNKVLYIPPYSPNFNPIAIKIKDFIAVTSKMLEEVFSQMKSYIRKYINPVTINKNIHKLVYDFSLSISYLGNLYNHAFG